MVKILYGNIIFTSTSKKFDIYENSYLVSKNGIIKGIYKTLPEEYKDVEVNNYKDKIIIPGLIDLHVHAPQYAFRGLEMDKELIDWLNSNTFPEEAKYKDIDYASKAYDIFAYDLLHSFTTRAAIFATIHKDATINLMDKLDKTGLITMVGKVNMDRNCPDYLKEDTNESYLNTIAFIEEAIKKNYKNTTPILTPRFIPSCSDLLLDKLKEIEEKYNMPIQSHLSENLSEIEWVKELCPNAKTYADAYNMHGLFGGNYKTLMAHCVYSSDLELKLIKDNGVYIVHCPESNTNLRSGIAPIRKYLDLDLNIGLGSDVAGGTTLNMFKSIEECVKCSKLRWRVVDSNYKFLNEAEAFYLATKKGGSFFGNVGSFEEGYELDVVVIDDSKIKRPSDISLENRITGAIYLSNQIDVIAKYVKGNKVL
jgi:guanine deaminase